MSLVTATETWSYVHGLKPLRHEVGKRTSGRRSLSSPSWLGGPAAGGRVAVAEFERRPELVLRRLQEVACR